MRKEYGQLEDSEEEQMVVKQAGVEESLDAQVVEE